MVPMMTGGTAAPTSWTAKATLMKYPTYPAPPSRSLTSPDDINAYIEWLSSSRKLSATTTKRRLACLRAMFNWLERIDKSFLSPFRNADVRIALPKRLPRCLSAAELRSLFTVAKAARVWLRLIITLLFSTRMRVSELTDVRLGDVDTDRRTITVSRERVVFLPTPELAQKLMHYVSCNRKGCPSTAPLFVNRTGAAISPASVRRAVRGLAKKAEISRRITPHMLRHWPRQACWRPGWIFDLSSDCSGMRRSRPRKFTPCQRRTAETGRFGSRYNRAPECRITRNYARSVANGDVIDQEPGGLSAFSRGSKF